MLHTKINPAKERTNNNSPRSLFLSILLLTKRLQFPSPHSSFRPSNQGTDPKLKKLCSKHRHTQKNFKTKKIEHTRNLVSKQQEQKQKKNKQTNTQIHKQKHVLQSQSSCEFGFSRRTKSTNQKGIEIKEN